MPDCTFRLPSNSRIGGNLCIAVRNVLAYICVNAVHPVVVYFRYLFQIIDLLTDSGDVSLRRQLARKQQGNGDDKYFLHI